MAGNTRRGLDRYGDLAGRLDRFPLGPGYGGSVGGAFRARRLRGLQDAYRMSQGEEYRNPLVADLVEGR